MIRSDDKRVIINYYWNGKKTKKWEKTKKKNRINYRE